MDFSNIALRYAERYGIIDYTIKDGLMIWLKSYPAYLGEPHYTVKHILDLRTGIERTERLKRYNKRGELNR